MARVDADRNLLLGILAQQMDFVTRDALFAAMNAWIIRKETPLGALLVERGDLAKSRRDLLEALVDEHVKAHGDDPARSLQALSSVGSVANDLGRLPDADLQASVGHLHFSETMPPSTDPFETRTPEWLGQPTSWNGRFRVVRPHASGGLGVVSVALDDELDREVAFKEIKDKFADDDGRRARFVLEAEITGKLEHPGIIPIYGLGHDPTGRPFYAMRFIRGDSLADAIHRFHDPNGPYVAPTKKSLQLRELLGRFLDVCNALAYAHSRGVLHRDLKPGNIMLGPFGETLVVDWGLALPLDRVPEGLESPQGAVKSTKTDSASLPREQGQVVGTPAYMPPEQAEGALEKLGPRSDVYGLGAILYDLLTGQRPVQGSSLEEVLHRVGRGEIKPPRQVRPEIPAPLEAICLKALALRPEDRYATTRALAIDIKSWLADEPISARREPFAERARRWAKRNRTVVTTAAASLLVGLVGLGSVAAVQTKARNELDRKNGDLTVANEALDVQRGRAEAREAQAIDAVKKFGDVIANEPELKKTPALEGLRKRLMNEPLAFFRTLRERLQADRDTRPEALARLAGAGSSLGHLTYEIGDREDALVAFRESLTIFRKLAEANPAVTAYQDDLAANHNSIGIMLRDIGKPEEALKSFEAALDIKRRLAETNPAVTEFQARLATSHSNIGVLMSDTGKPDEALKSYEAALDIRRRLALANPADTASLAGLAVSHSNIGVLLSDTGKPDEALKSYEAARDILRRLVETNAAVTEFQANLATSHNNIGLLLRDNGKPDEALKSFDAALDILRRLAQANPAATAYQNVLAISQHSIGVLQRDNGKPDEALRSFDAALDINRRLALANPAVSEFQAHLAGSHTSIGNLLSAIDKPEEARKSYEAALDINRRLALANPAVTEFQADLAGGHYNIGNLLKKTGKLDDALKSYEAALEISRKLAGEHPESPDFASRLGGTLNSLATIDLLTRRYEVGRVRLREAVEWQQKALASNPANPNYRQSLTNNVINLIKAAEGLGDSQGVAEAERELARLRDSDPRMLAIDARLPAILQGDKHPKDNLERLQLAQRAYDKAFHAAAAKLWGDAFVADPKLAEDRQTRHRYNAARAASLAGCSQGKDDPAPDDVTRVKLREQARTWLQAELAVWTRIVETGPAIVRSFVVQTLQHWREDADLAGIREPKALEAFPEAERMAWRALWAGVDALLTKAHEAPAPVGAK